MKIETVATNGIRLRVEQHGPADGPLAILLHGFPESSFGWRHQVGPLAEAGYRVWVPDQRGYNTSDKPKGVANYALEELTKDAIGLIDAAGRGRASLVGHDWGGIVAWWAALTRPHRVERLAILNAPHPVAMQRHLMRDPKQMLRSWYVAYFQLPRVPEALFRRRDWKAAEAALVGTSRPGTFTASDLAEYRRAWSQPGAFRAMIHWYRAAVRHRPVRPADPIVRIPTLIIWGVRDRFLRESLAHESVAHCEGGRLERIDEATHWVQHEEPERVNRLLLDFLGG